MKPLINSPGHVKALEFLQALHETGPSAQVGWSLGEAWDYFLRGKAVFVFSWGDVGSLCQDTKRSRIQGDCAASILPASQEYYDQAENLDRIAESGVRLDNCHWHCEPIDRRSDGQTIRGGGHRTVSGRAGAQ